MGEQEVIERTDEIQEEPKPKPKPKPVLVAVRTISTQGEGSLVEWQAKDGAHRAYVPASEVDDGVVEQSILDAAPAYGEPWEALIANALPVDLPARIGDELRRKGLWTLEDIAQNAANTRNAFITALGLSPATLKRLAEERK